MNQNTILLQDHILEVEALRLERDQAIKRAVIAEKKLAEIEKSVKQRRCSDSCEDYRELKAGLRELELSRDNWRAAARETVDCAEKLFMQVAPTEEGTENPWTKGVGLAVIGRNHFGNPIPQAWYSAARDLLEKVGVK